ncbi:GNAT family N-acetyltransferase [Senegalia massiliensis]|uniref:GNAT family N-acetyltransferase n=1 Tax=Senegalia massiliensis TaxID=1720316 RepID=UPI0013630E3A
MISSKRLFLKPFKYDDNEFLYKLNNNRKVNKYLGTNSVSMESCNSLINKWIKKYRNDYIFNVHKVILKAKEESIGFICLKKDSNDNEAELGYNFIPKYWGYGYCTEIATELIKNSFEETQIERVFAEIHPENTRSIRLIKRLNFKEDNKCGNNSGKLYYFDKNIYHSIDK